MRSAFLGTAFTIGNRTSTRTYWCKTFEATDHVIIIREHVKSPLATNVSIPQVTTCFLSNSIKDVELVKFGQYSYYK